MAAMTVVKTSAPGPNGKTIVKYSGTSAANQTDTLTTPAVGKGGTEKVLYAYVVYSASPTETGVTYGIDSGLGAAYDATLETESANTQVNQFLPTVPIPLLDGDAFLVTCPAAGGVITAKAVVVVEQS